MKRLIIICEGETEQEFCNDVLSSHFLSKKIFISAPTIKKTNGGIASWGTLKKQIENHLKHENSAFVTTLIDFYGTPKDFYCLESDKVAKTNAMKVTNMEAGMKKNIESSLSYRFIPYIQLHEFESLAFCSLSVLKNNFKPEEADFPALESVINAYPNPEDINNSLQTAPSKRLEKHIKGYNKPTYGACLTTEIGLSAIREKCPRFNGWIEQLEKI